MCIQIVPQIPSTAQRWSLVRYLWSSQRCTCELYQDLSVTSWPNSVSLRMLSFISGRANVSVDSSWNIFSFGHTVLMFVFCYVSYLTMLSKILTFCSPNTQIVIFVIFENFHREKLWWKFSFHFAQAFLTQICFFCLKEGSFGDGFDGKIWCERRIKNSVEKNLKRIFVFGKLVIFKSRTLIHCLLQQIFSEFGWRKTCRSYSGALFYRIQHKRACRLCSRDSKVSQTSLPTLSQKLSALKTKLLLTFFKKIDAE